MKLARDELVAAADRNFVGGLRTLIGLQPGSEERRFGAALAFDSRIQSAPDLRAQ